MAHADHAGCRPKFDQKANGGRKRRTTARAGARDTNGLQPILAQAGNSKLFLLPILSTQDQKVNNFLLTDCFQECMLLETNAR